MSPKKRTSCLSIFGLLVAGILCLGAVGAAGALWYIPNQVRQVLGPPDAQLEPTQRIYLSLRLYLLSDDLTLPNEPYSEKHPFRIELGESPIRIANRLEQEGFISNAEAFRMYLIYSGLDKTIQAGEYMLDAGQPPLVIAVDLQDATPSEISFSILPGWRLEEIAAALPTSGLDIQPQTFLAAAASPSGSREILSELPPHATLEGFLPPETYTLPRDIDVQTLIDTFLERFENQLDGELRRGFERQDLSLFEAVTLASIVQREAVVEEEMPLIASVFINRLRVGTPLETDPTVQYAVGYNQAQKTWWTNPLGRADLQLDSPYNTYVYDGLPPGPIASPTVAALRAVAFPAQTPYYYFRAACDGSGKHTFSETFQEHLQAGCP